MYDKYLKNPPHLELSINQKKKITTIYKSEKHYLEKFLV